MSIGRNQATRGRKYPNNVTAGRRNSSTATSGRGFSCAIFPRHGFFVWMTLLVSSVARAAFGQEQPLLEQEPYDVIRLNAANGHKELKVEALPFPNRVVPKSPKATDKLDFQLLEAPDNTYTIDWRDIEKVILYEDRVLAKANQLVAAAKLDEAYDYFKYLYDQSPHTVDLGASYENYLYEEAKLSHRNQKYDEALALLRQLHAGNPKRPSLDKAMGLATDKLVEQYVAQKRYDAARVLIQDLIKAFPDHPTATDWQERIRNQAETYLRDGQTAAQKGNWIKASEQSRLLTELRPALPGAKEFALEIQQNYPRVVVGVMSASQTGGRNVLADWALRRNRRLYYRTLTEYLGPGMEGGQYLCPVGKCTIDAESLGRRLFIQLKPGVRFSLGDTTLTSYDVSRRLWLMADPNEAAFDEDWAELLEGVAVKGGDEVEVQLRHPHVRPEALLQTPLRPYAESFATNGPPPSNGPFLLTAPIAAGQDAKAESNGSPNPLRKDEAVKWAIPPTTTSYTETVFQANPQYFAAKPTQPKELIERHYPVGTNAVLALKRGEIQVLDRIAPWNLQNVRNDPKIAVGKYNVPTIHCLVPNFRRPLVMSRTFRRALAYGLNREAILSQLLDKGPIEGCRVVSGPFPAGISTDDPLSYAYDDRIEPRLCDPHMAMALTGLELKELKEAEKKNGREVKKLPTIVLAYPDDEIAAVACRSIRYQLNLVHIPLELKPLKGPIPNRVPDDVDLLYAELAIGEPVTDAVRLFGENGLAGGGSPYIGLAVKQLEQASDWAKIREQLRRLHRIAFDDVTVVPLWQLVDFYAYRKENRGIGERPFTIYQNIEQWQPVFFYPDGE